MYEFENQIDNLMGTSVAQDRKNFNSAIWKFFASLPFDQAKQMILDEIQNIEKFINILKKETKDV